MATTDVAAPLPSQGPLADASSLFAFSTMAASRSPSGSSSTSTRNEVSEGEDGAHSEGSAHAELGDQPDEARLRGGYRCSKCGRPKKGHVCPTGGGSYMNLTFIGYDDKVDAGDQQDPERRLGLLRRVDLLEREVTRLANENSQLRAALQSHQSSNYAALSLNSFGSFTLPQSQQQQPQQVHQQQPQQQQQRAPQGQQQLYATPVQQQPRNYALPGDYDMQPQAKRPRFDHAPSSPNSGAQMPNPNQNQGGMPNQNAMSYDASRMNLPVSMDSHPHPSAFSHPQPSMHQQAQQQQMYMPTPSQAQPQSSSEHAWLRIPKPQSRSQNVYPSQGF